MSTITPYKGLSLDRLVALINKDNGTQLVPTVDFTVADLKPVVRDDFRNTSIRVTPTDPEFRPQTLHYRRLSLSVLQALESDFETVEIDSVPFKIHDLLPKLNQVLGLDLTPEEVENTEYTRIAEGYLLKIASDTSSLAWTKSVYRFKANVKGLIRITTDGLPRRTTDGAQRRLAGLDTI